uniref:Dynein axonemal intermediate chain 4 n=1 Tax=Amphilophus citrinellus TaxID=61819 RepID=A0A3Q0R1H1_AMPCI
KDTATEQVTEDMLKEVVDIFISETDTFSLLDIPGTCVSVDADDADAIIARNSQYEEVCRNRAGHGKDVDRSVQTLNGATKNKQVQSNSLIMVDAGKSVMLMMIFINVLNTMTGNIPNHRTAITSFLAALFKYPAERQTFVSGSLKEVEVDGNSLNTELEWELIVLSEKFQHCLLAMEKSILRNNSQPQLAAYRQLAVLEEPGCPVKPDLVEPRKGGTESSQSPALECLWVFSCELSRGRSVSCMAWNRKNPDLLAVGYGGFDFGNQTPGLVCCWSIKNLKWPERVIHCDSTVTSLDFSASSPSQLAVGTRDGSITIYSVHSQDNRSQIVSSRESPSRHMGPVWQLRWMQQELSSSGEEKEEALLSVGADGRISKWFFFKHGFDCTDVMKLKRIQNTKKAGRNKTETMTGSVLTALTPGLCFDFHPTDSSIYLTGTWEGLIHKCSFSNTQQFVETYSKHFCPVNCVAWSPFNPDVFLSCSSDWTIQLWKQDHSKPLLGFTSAQKAVCDVKWSPKWATVFGAVNEEQLEIWDLNLSILDPVIVQPAAPGVRMTSLLFSSQTDCVVVGDSVGEVAVYQLKNFSVAERSQVNFSW